MICRICPRCGSKWYSAATQPWTCDRCGKLLNNSHNEHLRLVGVNLDKEPALEGTK